MPSLTMKFGNVSSTFGKVVPRADDTLRNGWENLYVETFFLLCL